MVHFLYSSGMWRIYERRNEGPDHPALRRGPEKAHAAPRPAQGPPAAAGAGRHRGAGRAGHRRDEAGAGHRRIRGTQHRPHRAPDGYHRGQGAAHRDPGPHRGDHHPARRGLFRARTERGGDLAVRLRGGLLQRGDAAGRGRGRRGRDGLCRLWPGRAGLHRQHHLYGRHDASARDRRRGARLPALLRARGRRGHGLPHAPP